MSMFLAEESAFTVRDGLATLHAGEISLSEAVDRAAVAAAREAGAVEIGLPPLVRVADLQSIDYFDNFPQLASLVTRPVDPARVGVGSGPGATVPSDRLADATYALPSSACYNAYFGLKDTAGLPATVLTTRARCFRNEERHEGLRRLWGFEMREVVYLGDAEGAAAHLATYKNLLSDWCARLRLDATWRTAVDPFFDRTGPRALAQGVIPIKEELLYLGKLAIASLNAHRNFFGERCRITGTDGEFVHTSCVGLGLERWTAALLDQDRSSEEMLAGLRELR
jgi:hypothetical protein